MFKNILKIIVILILAILQITLLPFLSVKGVWPNLILLTAIVLIILDFDSEAFLLAILGGLILDLASPLFFGFNLLTILAITYLAKLAIQKFITEPNIFIIAILIFIIAIIQDLAIIMVTRNFILTTLLINGFYSAIAGVLLYQLLNHWFKKAPPIKMVIK